MRLFLKRLEVAGDRIRSTIFDTRGSTSLARVDLMMLTWTSTWWVRGFWATSNASSLYAWVVNGPCIRIMVDHAVLFAKLYTPIVHVGLYPLIHSIFFLQQATEYERTNAFDKTKRNNTH